MSQSLLPLPVTVEQIAAVIRHMSRADRQRLLQLVPELRPVRLRSQSRTATEARTAVERLREQVMEAVGHQFPSPTAPFLGRRTLAEYLDLEEGERARLWDEWGGADWEDPKELEVRPDALPAR